MAITTDFIGHVGIEPALDSDQIDRLAALRAAARDEGQPRLPCGWVACEDGCCLTHDGDEKYGDPADWLRYLVRSFLKPRGLRADGMVVGLPAGHQGAVRHPGAGQPGHRESPVAAPGTVPRDARQAVPSRRPTAQVIDLATRRARA